MVGLALLIAATGLGCGASLESTMSPGPRNVLLISVDTLRADHLSGSGYFRETIP